LRFRVAVADSRATVFQQQQQQLARDNFQATDRNSTGGNGRDRPQVLPKKNNAIYHLADGLWINSRSNWRKNFEPI
jgi:hypothetical protein